MKANQNFRTEEEAVSPVIGVILMVAITVVLAAVVFVLVSDLGGGDANAQPAISWKQSEAGDYAEVTSAEADADWSEFELKMSQDGRFRVGAVPLTGDATTVSPDGVAGEWVTMIAGGIGGGDKLYFCVDSSAGPALTVTLRHIDSNAVAKEFSFNSVAQCSAT